MEKETMETANTGQEAQQPLLRVFLFGEFRLVWQVTPFTQDTLWNSRTSARTLFKLLLCAPGRQASRSQLAGILWPETDEGKARESLLLSRLARLDSRRVSGIEREALGRALSESIMDGWQDLYSLDNAQAVALGRTQLALIHQAHALLAPATLAYLYAGAYSFLGIGLHFQMRDEEALQAYHQGHMAALATGDPWYVAQSLICQADSYHALGQYSFAIQTIEEALRLLASASAEDERMTRSRAHLLCCWADHAMMLHDERTTQAKLDLAEATLYADETNEEFDRAAWLLIAGKYALRKRKTEVARARFAEALSLLPAEWLLRRAMTGTGPAMATARLGNRDASLGLAKDLLPLISTTNAPITTRWYADYLQRDLLNAFPADTDIQLFVAEASRQLPPPANLLHPGS